jgi:hypothetical protein
VEFKTINDPLGKPEIRPKTNVSIPPALGPKSLVTNKTFSKL